MNVIVFLVGLCIILITAHDFFYTTLSSNGAGIITHKVTKAIWSLFLNVSKLRSNRSVLKFSGITIMLFLFSMWIMLLWIGLFVMLVSEEISVVTSSKGLSASLLDKFYYSGYVLSTMGNGDFKPGAEFWQVITAIFSFAGFIFITTGISYIISVSSAIINKRTLSLTISNLGNTPQQILLRTWNGNDFSRLLNYVPQLQQQINRHVQNHMAFPILHFFHTGRKKDAIAVNITNLDEALSIVLLFGEPDKTNQGLTDGLHPLRDALYFYLASLKGPFIQATDGEQDFPNLSSLEGMPIKPSISGDEIKNNYDPLKQRRMLLSGLLQNGGWNWKDIYPSEKVH
ncbi:hypothetical protein OKW21_004466 [Catalinimonas alkaloidigena]|uniref:potassium channel family protein n=1 Tax=Catalinimonas alkaloidigena TaxID=1075417 RepID=UPI0024053224|nr:potassium channel family protein [Catalinimonas alkaloidigena]MDF9799203.1 hypothetical protein [Catalinimonas alkaloidigena]